MDLLRSRTWLVLPMLAISIGAASLLALSKEDANADKSAGCISPQEREIGHGPSPTGPHWHVRVHVKNNGSCKYWLLAVDFRLPGLSSWRSATGISANDHLSEVMRINAMDTRGKTSAAFSGYMGSNVGNVQATFEDGTRVNIAPQLPPRSLRQRFVWLRGLAFFVHYHAVESRVVSISVFDRKGKRLYRVNGEDGVFF